MKKSGKKQGTIRNIKNITLTDARSQECFDILKTQVGTKEKVMITVSGGSDSILTACLVYNFFIKNTYNLQNLFFIHCNHGTRTGNIKDEQFVRAFFKGMQLIVVKRNSKKKLATYGVTMDTEATLRERRYREFKNYAKKLGIKKIIFGHNLTDRIESTFLNLLRGAHINGFLAIKHSELHHLLPGIQVIRPILGITKNEVLEICKKNKIPFIIDPTNKDIKTSLRNKLRNTVLPELYKLSNKQNATTNSFIESIKNIYATLEETEKKILNSDSCAKICNKNGTLHSIKKSQYWKANFAYQRHIDPSDITNKLMMETMKKLHIANNTTTPLLNELTKFLTNSESGYKYVNGTYIFKSHGEIYIISAPKAFREKMIDNEKKIDNITTKRFPRKGDRYKGKTRNEWCINQKIPIFRRNFIPIVVKNNQIIQIIR